MNLDLRLYATPIPLSATRATLRYTACVSGLNHAHAERTKTKDITYIFETPSNLSVEKRALRLRSQPHRREATPAALYVPVSAV